MWQQLSLCVASLRDRAHDITWNCIIFLFTWFERHFSDEFSLANNFYFIYLRSSFSLCRDKETWNKINKSFLHFHFFFFFQNCCRMPSKVIVRHVPILRNVTRRKWSHICDFIGLKISRNCSTNTIQKAFSSAKSMLDELSLTIR